GGGGGAAGWLGQKTGGAGARGARSQGACARSAGPAFPFQPGMQVNEAPTRRIGHLRHRVARFADGPVEDLTCNGNFRDLAHGSKAILSASAVKPGHAINPSAPEGPAQGTVPVRVPGSPAEWWHSVSGGAVAWRSDRATSRGKSRKTQ